ncbi:hypothetical protein NQ315_014734 [Exocentrus adspersus]|uniref:DUF7869 domain-containing protein n=1 Tax=Exocentrus adspersus TaxID=1586481 RepID=A0AAV8VED9_9CUCU|nr:hypothetical protein NQ315_014734 [Exocentrus adspersus]
MNLAGVNYNRQFPLTDPNATCEPPEKIIRSQYQSEQNNEMDPNQMLDPLETAIHDDYIIIDHTKENIDPDDDQSLFGNDYSDENPTYTPPKPPKLPVPSPSDTESDENEELPTEALSPAISFQDEIQMEPIKTWITSLLDKVLDDVWRKVHKPKRWKKSNPSEWKVNIAKKRRAEGNTYTIKNKLRAAKMPRSVDCICQKFFTATLCICVDVILDAISKRDSLGCYSSEDKRGKREPINKTNAEDVKFVKEHIESFPVMESHYTRKDTLRKYLDSTLNIKKMYLLYTEKCKEHNRKPVSENKYRRIFVFLYSKKDQCLICVNYAKSDSEKKKCLQESYEEHRKRNQVCQEAKKLDKEKANEDKTFMSVTMDLQAILQIPKGAVGQLYYVRKLVVYNLTIFESPLPNNAYCLCWNEIHGKKGSCEIGTCLYYYLSNCLPSEVNHITIFSDTCGGQNRNQFISALLLWAVHKIDHLNIIEQKFLESGHTYMEADSMHSAIESASKNVDITSMSDWKNVFRRARRQKVKTVNNTKYTIEPYQVKEMKYGDFFNIKKLADSIMKNKTTDTDGNSVKWLKIKRIKYVKGKKDSIFFNYDLSEEFKCLRISNNSTLTAAKRPLTRSKRSIPSLSNEELPDTLQKLYNTVLPISEKKKKDLIKMCKEDIFPEELHSWINNLKTAENLLDRLPDAAVEDSDDEEDA